MQITNFFGYFTRNLTLLNTRTRRPDWPVPIEPPVVGDPPLRLLRSSQEKLRLLDI